MVEDELLLYGLICRHETVWKISDKCSEGNVLMYKASAPISLKFQPHFDPRLKGLTICHLSNLHQPRAIYQQLDRLASTPIDLLMLTGPYVKGGLGASASGFDSASGLLEEVVGIVRPRYGGYGVFSSDDAQMFRSAVKGMPIHWLGNETVVHGALPLNVTGVSESVGYGGSGDFLGAHLNGFRETARPHLGFLLLPGVEYLRYSGKIYHEYSYLRGEAGPYVRCGGANGGVGGEGSEVGVGEKEAGWEKMEIDSGQSAGALPLFILE